jgi:hypothetical protein
MVIIVNVLGFFMHTHNNDLKRYENIQKNQNQYINFKYPIKKNSIINVFVFQILKELERHFK